MEGGGTALLVRQLQHIVDGGGRSDKDASATFPASAADTLRLLPALWNANGAPQSSSDASSSSSGGSGSTSSDIHKLALRIEALLKDVSTCRQGLQLARLMLDALPWQLVAPSYASNWVTSAMTNIHHPGIVLDAITVLDVLLGTEARAYPEYWRHVGAPNAAKYGIALIDAAEKAHSIVEQEMVLEALSRQVSVQPSIYRTHAPRIQKLCMDILFGKQVCLEATAKLLSRLPLTGKDRETQMQLWSATLQLLLAETRRAWSACSSVYQPDSEVNKATADGSSNYYLPALSLDDDVAAAYEGHRRLSLLLGSPKAGILPLFLGQESSTLMPVPIDDLVNLALDILGTTPNSRARRGAEVTLHTVQSALLPQAHLQALVLAISLPLRVYHGRHIDILQGLLRLIQHASPTVRCAAFNVMRMLSLPQCIDLASPLLLRCSRTCLAQAARLLRAPSEASLGGAKQEATSTHKPHKRRRLFDADQVVFSQNKGFVEVCEDEMAACISAVGCLPMCFEGLATNMSSDMHDLAHTTALLLLGMLEMAIKEDQDALTVALLESAASVVRNARGAVLGLLCPRAANLCALALASSSMEISRAAKSLQYSLADAMHPKLPPKLALRLHVETEQLDGIAESGLDDDGAVLGDAILTERAGEREREALRDVLLIDEQRQSYSTSGSRQEIVNQMQETADPVTHETETPNKSTRATASAYSPDPVKPVRRPITPRIGSPTAAAVSLSPDRRQLATSTTSTPGRGPSPSSMFRASRASKEDVEQPARDLEEEVTSRPPSPVLDAAAGDVPETLHTSAPAEQDQPSVNTAPVVGRKYYDSDDDSDFSIPEIDMRSDGDLSEEEEQGNIESE